MIVKDAECSPDGITRRQALQLAGAAAVTSLFPVTRAFADADAGVLRVGMGATGPSEPIDPVSGYSSQTLSFILYDRLTWMDTKQQVIPELATKWTHNEDFTEWLFDLRTDVTFHDGRPLNANDVVTTFRRMLNPSLGSQARRLFATSLEGTGITAERTHTVKFKCIRPFWNLPAMVSDSHLSIVPSDAPLDKYIDKAVGTGPFRLQDYKAGQHLFAVANKAYWRKGFPKLSGIKVYNVAEVSQRVNGLVSRQFDLVVDLDALSVQPIKERGGVHVYSVPSGTCININMVADTKPFADNRVREALKLACDRQSILNSVWFGEGSLGTDQPISPVSRLWGDVPIPKHDVSRARKLLSEAGYPNGLDLTLTTSDIYAGAVSLAEAYQEQAKAAGIRIKLSKVPASNYYYNLDSGKWNFFVEPWYMRPDDGLIFIEYAPRGKKLAPTHWYPDKFKRALKEARDGKSSEERKKKYRAVEEMISREGPSIVSTYINTIDAASSKVSDYSANPIGFYRQYWPIRLED